VTELRLNIKSWFPRHERKWELRSDGSRDAMIFTDYGIVEVFAFPGSDRQRAFTQLSMYIAPNCYHATLPRRYHDRWIHRLVRQFAWDCSKLDDARSERRQI
jgi:hypothetical protein